MLPQQVFPPLFNRYDAGMTFGSHVDNAIRAYPDTALRIRTDVSSTLFLSEPDDYDGGELVVEDTYGSHAVKLPAGDMIVYPGTSLHHVTPITRGSRIASFFWTQSLIRDVQARAAVRPRHGDQSAQRRSSRASDVVSADLALSQPAAAMGRGVKAGRR